MTKPTDKQLQLINNIEKTLSIKFEGKTKKDAWEWTKKHMPQVNEIRKAIKPTEKQLIAIHNIEKILNVKFTGESKRDAWVWTQEHMPKAVNVVIKQYFDTSSVSVNVTGVHSCGGSPNDFKLRYLETIENLSKTPDQEALNTQISLLITGVMIF